MVHRPPILILDEPTAGVDVALRQSLWKEVRKLNEAGCHYYFKRHITLKKLKQCVTA